LEKEYIKNYNDNILTLAPEFDLPEPDEELIPGNTEAFVNSGEDVELSYELGELDELDL